MHFHGETYHKPLVPVRLHCWLPGILAGVLSPQKWLGHFSLQDHSLLSLFQLHCSPAPFICNLQEGGGLGAQEAHGAAGGGAGVPLTAEASFTHPATHVPLYGPGFLSVLKGDCEKSRADSGCLAVSWQQAWQEVFLSPPNLPSLLHNLPFPFPPVSCVVYH